MASRRYEHQFSGGEGNGHYQHEVYHVRPPRLGVVIGARVGGGGPGPVTVLQSTAMIQVWFTTDYRSGSNWRQDKYTQLVKATYSNEFATVAEFPAKVDVK